jgi:murein L,D-transpeptidase YcbB/YkuD
MKNVNAMATVSALKKVILFTCSLFILLTARAFGDTTTYRLENASVQSTLLQKELNRLYQLEQKGGWTKISVSKKYYMKDQTDPDIKKLKKRLHESGDLDASDSSDVFTDELKVAVMRLQKQFGHRANGVVDALLIKELNVPLQDRIDQLRANMDRYNSITQIPEGTWLVANIPEFKLHVYDGQQHVFDMDIVVGKESAKTVIFNDEIKYIVFSPCWNVPPSIVQNEILPAMRTSPGYLRRNGYVQTGTENGLPVIKQLPGPNNSLGRVKFVFPNSHNIYFHDTPAKSLFGFQKRAFSHGCIRLSEPDKLAAYLLRNTEWTEEKIQKAMNSGKEQFVPLQSPVAISITYFTAWVDETGLVHFMEDIYGLDKAQLNKNTNIAQR